MPDAALPLVLKFFPKFKLQDIDSGHWVISEQPELFIKGMNVTPMPAIAIVGLTQLVVVDFVSHHMASQDR